jgi:hypothetical protein
MNTVCQVCFKLRYLKKEGYSAQYVYKAEELDDISFERKTSRRGMRDRQWFRYYGGYTWLLR